VTGANNVIHLERHWNPAKEAQATDRVYRIGQQKDVNVYIPIALHPQQKSFDEHLNMLLNNKVDLSNAVVAPDIVEVDDMTTIF
jgi:SNF2 family DNA or RNA helicase